MNTKENRTSLKIKHSKEFTRNLVEAASDLIAPAWSLKKFVASNPLQGFEGLTFERASSKAKEYYEAEILPNENIAYNAYKKGDLKIELFEEAFSKRIEDPNSTFEFAAKQLSKKDFLLNSILNNKDQHLKTVQEASFKKFINQVAKENKDIFPREKTFKLISESSENSDFFRLVNSSLIRWLERFYDEGQASIEMPDREKGVFLAWKELALMKNLSKEQKDIIRDLPESSSEAIIELLISLQIEEADWEEYLRLSFLALPGWSSYIKWRRDYQGHSAFNKIAPPSLEDFLALRLALEKIFSLSAKQPEDSESLDKDSRDFVEWLFLGLLKSGFSKEEILTINLQELKLFDQKLIDVYLKKGIIYLEAIETSVNSQTQSALKTSLEKFSPSESQQRPDAQMVFCIDVRSEVFRRSIEAQGNYKTFGYAGFFGVPVRYHSSEFEETVDSLPVLLKPCHEVHEQSFEDKLKDKFKQKQSDSFIKSLTRSFKDLKVNFASIFVYSEASGLVYALRILLRTLFPKLYAGLIASVSKSMLPKIHYQPVLEFSNTDGDSGIPVEAQVTYGRNALRMIGLTENFAPYVIFCGHGSTTANNPYASALDCGACGGSQGGPNAKIIARILNSKVVRSELKKEGLDIPGDTVFLAAQHNTTDDSVEIFKDDDEHKLDGIKSDLKQAKLMTNMLREQKFSNNSPADTRSVDWSEARPEWGLAGNSCFIIAPRKLTQEINLDSRAFLHSYNHWQDDDGGILEVIMTAPMIVTQWINSQYYFSTVDNINFGSGSKITHNVMGTSAVIQGNSSDLMHGLALQSVNASDSENYHSPVRITNYIYAPLARVQKIIDKHEMLQKLIYNSWIKVVVIEPETGEFKAISGQ